MRLSSTTSPSSMNFACAGERLERIADFGRHHQHHVETDLAERSSHEAEELHGLDHGVARHVPGDRRVAELEFARVFTPHIEALVAERSQRAGGTPKLSH